MKRFLLCGVLISASIILYLQTENVAAQMTEENIYQGMEDASAAVALSEEDFIVANDEDNDLRIFGKNKSEAKQIVKLSEVFKDKIFDGEDLEIDIEGAAQLGDKIFWIGSHSTSKKGKFRAARNRLFAVSAKSLDGKYLVKAVGEIYTTLIADLEKDSRFNAYKFKDAKTITPKAIGGLSIEGLAAAPDGALLIAFRNPLAGGKTVGDFLIGGKALIVKLINPNEVIEGKPAKFAAPIELDLGGYGIRSLEYNPSKNHFLIVAGPYHENVETETHKIEITHLYAWSGKASDVPKHLKQIDLKGFNIESAFFFPQKRKEAVLLSDDGTLDKQNFRKTTRKLEK